MYHRTHIKCVLYTAWLILMSLSLSFFLSYISYFHIECRVWRLSLPILYQRNAWSNWHWTFHFERSNRKLNFSLTTMKTSFCCSWCCFGWMHRCYYRFGGIVLRWTMAMLFVNIDSLVYLCECACVYGIDNDIESSTRVVQELWME